MPGEVTVATLIGFRGASTGLDLDLLAGSAGLDRRITLPYIQKTGLALAGFDEYLRPGRVLIFGESEIRFLDAMDTRARVDALRRLFQRDPPQRARMRRIGRRRSFPCPIPSTGYASLRSSLTDSSVTARRGGSC